MQYCIFCERAFDDKCFEALKSFCINHPGKVKLFCITPVNYHLAVAEQGYSGTLEEFDKILAERYHEIEATGTKIELHLHLGLRLENIDQNELMGNASWWMLANGFIPELITYGWYIHNGESDRCEKEYGFKFYNDHHVYSFHDYEYDKVYKAMMIINNLRGILR